MWKSAFTRIVSHSSCESELMALDVGAMLSQFCGWLIQSMGGPLVDKVQAFVDNAGTISLASNPIQPGRNVHVHARYFYVRDLVFGDKLQIEKIPTELQVADIGCSYKGAPNFLRLVDVLMKSARIIHNEPGEPIWESSPSLPKVKQAILRVYSTTDKAMEAPLSTRAWLAGFDWHDKMRIASLAEMLHAQQHTHTHPSAAVQALASAQIEKIEQDDSSQQ